MTADRETGGREDDRSVASAAGSEPYRRAVVRLPLQRSLFRSIDRAAEAVGCTDVFPDGKIRARLDERGDLYLDRADLRLLGDILVERLDGDTAVRLDAAHRRACREALDATRAAAVGADLSGPLVMDLIRRLGSTLTLVVWYGILAKVVPDALALALHARSPQGGADLPFPSPSHGAVLARDLLDLSFRCSDLGHAPGELASRWPDIDPEVRSIIGSFCSEHAGFGPLAWDVPGYEEPGYVIHMLQTTLGHAAPSPRRSPDPSDAGQVDPLRAGEEIAEPLRRWLAFWLDFLERETWYVRRAFFAGLVPLLRAVATRVGSARHPIRPQDLLFLELDELTGDPGSLRSLLQARQEEYLEDQGSLRSRGIDPGRLSRMMGA